MSSLAQILLRQEKQYLMNPIIARNYPIFHRYQIIVGRGAGELRWCVASSRPKWSVMAAGSLGRAQCPPASSGSPANHLGPCHHWLPATSFVTATPRVSQSAGLFFSRQYLQDAGSTNCWISSSRFQTNGFQRLVADVTDARTTSLSLQNVMEWIGRSSAPCA
ncbi:hypothetical protein T07_13803 [Trichinella nelsoni]|uniref:Uncharacterized protein n=1 Tax=Trichinella nelsoni TaxID=6336 RepID=A0A0V0RFS9_9BILA|nr:hypothetical protein T07_13803 [Trichinella nelsoni]